MVGSQYFCDRGGFPIVLHHVLIPNVYSLRYMTYYGFSFLSGIMRRTGCIVGPDVFATPTVPSLIGMGRISSTRSRVKSLQENNDAIQNTVVIVHVIERLNGLVQVYHHHV